MVIGDKRTLQIINYYFSQIYAELNAELRRGLSLTPHRQKR